ncbi:MAG: hypothetical protein AAFQ35_07360, partial [Pseudomonadota bacterium]
QAPFRWWQRARGARPALPVLAAHARYLHALAIAQMSPPLPGRRPGARSLAVYLAHVTLGVSVHRLARVSGLTRKSIRRAIATVEDHRDDVAYDAHVSTAEMRLIP